MREAAGAKFVPTATALMPQSGDGKVSTIQEEDQNQLQLRRKNRRSSRRSVTV